MMSLVNRFGLGSDTQRVDNSFLILNDFFELPIHQEGEVIVAYEHCVSVVNAIKDVIISEQHPVNYITEVQIVHKTAIHTFEGYSVLYMMCMCMLFSLSIGSICG